MTRALTEETAAVPRMQQPAAGAAPRRRWRALRQVLAPVLLLLPGAVLLALVLVWPFLTMLGISFTDRYPNGAALTLDKYRDVLGDPYFLRIILRTFGLGLVVTAITALLGYPVAWYLARSRSRWKHLVFLGVIAPLLVSIVVRTMGWTILLGNEGLVNSALMALGLTDTPLPLMQSFWSVVLGMVHILLPFMVLSIATVLGKIDPSLSEAAALLGAHPVRNFLRVTLPLSAQGVAAGSVVVFCLSIGAYITPLWLGRGQVTVLAISIHEQMVVLVDWPTGAAASMVLTIGTFVILALYGLAFARHARR
ncbi:ABC transporter permease [Roseomonas sp. E05]|uniref:ABC transporter permease n=1 Tax=Roseomonas sp. E05 TaxID=3046310 RepID=UPI0024BA6216|nr:ABC transporter permease [Roseomonas sp. E05]MDJ0388770.1 ABC transporter permease [Roseomonas sp. E05]